MSKKYEAYTSIETMVTAADFNADGCSEYSLFNAGNVNVTIDGILVLEPRETWRGPSFNPEVGYYSKHKIEFDEANAPVIKTPVGGTLPPSYTVAPGDPAPAKDKRLTTFKTFIK